MTKSRFCALTMFLFLICPVFAGAAHKCDMFFSASVLKPGIWTIRINGDLDEVTRCLLMVAEPSGEWLVAVLDPDADEELIDAIIELNPVFMDFCRMNNLNVNADLSGDPFKTDRISFQIASLIKGVPIISEIVGVYSNTFERIEFGIEIGNESGTDSSGCIPMARCGTGRPFWGPNCDPCEYTICCYGSMGYIQCGQILCP